MKIVTAFVLWSVAALIAAPQFSSIARPPSPVESTAPRSEPPEPRPKLGTAIEWEPSIEAAASGIGITAWKLKEKKTPFGAAAATSRQVEPGFRLEFTRTLGTLNISGSRGR